MVKGSERYIVVSKSSDIFISICVRVQCIMTTEAKMKIIKKSTVFSA